ncbi:hypothetical protein [Dyella silvatica]|uniref:hypothetical protein n=1 Tax=Dyella silvatica TaxID=2992128 RepID=UPI0022517013|nr:hypothetical protein [Dyella silvatica]
MESDADCSATVGAKIVLSAGLDHWARQLLRISYQGQTATLWLRDFHLDDAQRSALTEHVLAHALSMGQPITRLVVNGKEVWRAVSTSPVADKEQETHGS